MELQTIVELHELKVRVKRDTGENSLLMDGTIVSNSYRQKGKNANTNLSILAKALCDGNSSLNLSNSCMKISCEDLAEIQDEEDDDDDSDKDDDDKSDEDGMSD